MSTRSAVDPKLVGLVGVLIGVLLALRLLVPEGFDPSVVGSFGEDSRQTDYAEELLGRQVATREALGHDGKFFFIQANDPWILQPEQHADWLDRPLYRAQRMLYPLLVSGFGILQGEAVLWGMLVVNVIAMGAGGWGGALLARSRGASGWWGLAFPLNPGMIGEFNIGGAGVVAFAAALGAVVALERGRWGWGAVLLSAAALTREAMLVFVIGAALLLLVRWRRVPWLVVAAPIGVVGGWAGYLRLRLPGGAGADQVQEIGPPLIGLLGAIPRWDLVDWAIGLPVLVLSALVLVRVVGRFDLLAWGALGFIPLALLFTRQVWVNHYDITRAVAPVLTAYVFASFVPPPPEPDREGAGNTWAERPDVRYS